MIYKYNNKQSELLNTLKQFYYRILTNSAKTFAVYELDDASWITVYYFKKYCLVETEQEYITKVKLKDFDNLYKVTNIIYP